MCVCVCVCVCIYIYIYIYLVSFVRVSLHTLLYTHFTKQGLISTYMTYQLIMRGALNREAPKDPYEHLLEHLLAAAQVLLASARAARAAPSAARQGLKAARPRRPTGRPHMLHLRTNK